MDRDFNHCNFDELFSKTLWAMHSTQYLLKSREFAHPELSLPALAQPSLTCGSWRGCCLAREHRAPLRAESHPGTAEGLGGSFQRVAHLGLAMGLVGAPEPLFGSGLSLQADKLYSLRQVTYHLPNLQGSPIPEISTPMFSRSAVSDAFWPRGL